MLAGLYEFPNIDVETELTLDEAVSVVDSWGCVPMDLTRESQFTHIFSHVEWDMKGYYLNVHEMPNQFRWVTMEEMEAEVPLPSAFSYFI